jgi:outer membrane protein OmpA-like peptidoglycan-associated protein
MILNNVFFDFDKAVLKSKSYVELEKLYRFLIANEDVKIQIEGHTDNVGNEKYNQQLSEQRAKVVFQYLIDKNILPVRLRFNGFGASKPIADNESEEGRAKNRRTEIVIL